MYLAPIDARFLRRTPAAVLLALILPSLAGCGEDVSAIVPIAPTGIRSGSRLKAIWEVAGGARRLAGWHDTELDVDCGFEGFVYGREHRCLPPVASASGYRFADAACTVPAVDWYGCGTPRFAISTREDSCAEAPELFDIGEPVDPSSVFYGDNGDCQPYPPDPDMQTFRLGPPVPLDTVVAAREEPDDSGQLWLVADDGARIPWGGWDGTRAVEPAHIRDGKLRWAPWIVAYQPNYTFEDPACTVPAAGKDTWSAMCPMDAVLLFDTEAASTCGETLVSFAELGAPLDHAYNSHTGRCAQITQETNSQFLFDLGPAIPDDELLEVGSVDEGDGPVRVRRATMRQQPILQTRTDPSLGGNAPPDGDDFVDATTGALLFPQLASDGSLRALPITSLGIAYVDPTCTERVVAVPTDGCQELPPTLTFVEPVPDGCTAARAHVFPIEDEVPGGTPIHYDDGAGGCTPAAPAAEHAYRRLGAELSPADFAEVTMERDR